MIPLNSPYSRIMSIEPLRRQSIVTLFTTIMLTLIGFASTMYFAHAVGASILGAYFLFVAYYNVFKLLSDGGLNSAATKRISEGKEKNEYFSALVSIRVLLLLLSVSFLLLFRNYLVDINSSGMFYWLIIALTIAVFWTSVSTGIYGSGKVGINQVCGFVSSAGRVVFQIVAIYLGFSAGGLAGGFVLGMAAAGLYGMRFLDFRFVKFTKEHLKSLFSFSIWIFLSASGSLIYEYADTILIGYFLENADVGIYKIAFQFSSAAAFTTIAMKTVLYPKMSHWSANDKLSMVESALSKSYTYSLMLAVPVFVGGIILGDKMLYLFYGEIFASGSKTLYVLLAVQIVNVFMFLQNSCLNSLDKPKESFKVAIVASSANILLDLLLIPFLGIFGAALATFFTMSINAILSYRVLSNIISIKLDLKSLKNIVLSSILMGVFLIGFRMFVKISNVWIMLIPIILSACFYSVLLLKFDDNIRNETICIVKQIALK